MDDHTQRFVEHARAVRSAAELVERDAGEPACAPLAAEALTSVELALHALSRACYAAGRSIIPTGEIHESISARYARATTAWPGSTAPSHEQQARLLASLDDAGAALRAAAESTARAGGVLAAIVGDVDRDEPRQLAA